MERRAVWVIGLFVALFVGGCGGCEDPPGNGGTDGALADGDGVADLDGDAPVDGEAPDSRGMDGAVDAPEASSSDGASEGDADACGPGRRHCDGMCVDASSNRNHCGTCGNQCSGIRTCVDGSCECPKYHESCGGKCVATNLNGNHCGGCQNPCTGQTACAGGRCEEECPPTLEKCGNSCVDTQTDRDHCGGCGDACPSGEACTFGNCETPISTGSPPAKCRGGGPPVRVDFGGKRGTKCTGNVARTTFRWAVCSCDDVRLQNKLRTDAYDSTLGPYTPGGYGGGVGTNGRFWSNNETRIWGSLWTSSAQGIWIGNKTDVKQQLHSGGTVQFENETHIRGDARVDGDVTGGGPITFHGALELSPSGNIGNNVTTKGPVTPNSFTVSKVCSRCRPGRGIPVGQIVRNHQPPNHDNGLINLSANALQNPGQDPVLVLPCGKYYLNGATVDEKLTILATGRTALFIDGDFVVNSEVIMRPTPAGELDVFVSGKVEIDNKVWIGSPAYPASTRFYVGGTDGWIQRNEGTIGAYIYARPGGIRAGNKLRVYGGIYTQNLDVKNTVDVHFDRQILTVGKRCPDPTPRGGGDAGMDAGGDVGDGGDADGGGGGATQCSEKGESCRGHPDCCSPLVCDGGSCQSTSCKVVYESCSSGSECCSGNCATSGGTSICVSQ